MMCFNVIYMYFISLLSYNDHFFEYPSNPYWLFFVILHIPWIYISSFLLIISYFQALFFFSLLPLLLSLLIFSISTIPCFYFNMGFFKIFFIIPSAKEVNSWILNTRLPDYVIAHYFSISYLPANRMHLTSRI